MDKIEKIRQEIEMLYDGEAPKHDQQCDFSDGYFTGLSVISNFLDTLSEEPDKSLEEAAEISFDEAGALTEDYRDFLAKGLTENKPRPIGPHWFCEYAKNRFIVGAKWQKEQMMKDAVEGEVIVPIYEGDDIWSAEIEIPGRYEIGDKVRIVVLKEEEE